MRTTTTRSVLLLLTTVAIGACGGGWSDAEEYAFPVFSEDGVGVAAVHHTFEAKDVITHTKTRGYALKVLVKDTASDTTFQTLTGSLTGRVEDLFYMRDEGYIVVGRKGDGIDKPGGGIEGTLYYDKVTMDGTVTSLGGGLVDFSLSCDGGTSHSSASPALLVIPSPDGTLLARFESETTCQARTEWVTLLDASDLSVVGGPYTVPGVPAENSGMGPMWPPVEMAWSEDGAFLISYWGFGPGLGALTATAYRVGSDPEEGLTVQQDCFWPPTSSGDTKADGTNVDIRSETGALQYDEGGMVFGCGS